MTVMSKNINILLGIYFVYNLHNYIQFILYCMNEADYALKNAFEPPKLWVGR